MREILFRGKRTENGEWIYGSLLVDYPCCKNGVDETVKLYSIHDFKTNEEEVKKVEVIPETVGQYTGLTDKNGKRIFEGDILNTTNSDYAIWCVDSINTAFCCNQGNANYSCVLDEFMRFSDVEVIGNIHDNPELLEVEV